MKVFTIREFTLTDLNGMIEVWNGIVEEGNAFPQTELLNERSAKDFFGSQSFCAVAVAQDGQVLGLYILHPNNIGRCGHIANASYAVSPKARGRGVGRALVSDSLDRAKKQGFRILQFNAVVRSNRAARRLYESLGFVQLGVIPGGFQTKDGGYVDICPYYHTL